MLCYTRFWSRVAHNCLNFALVLLIVRETDRAFLSSLLVLALVVPSTVAGIVAGAAADAFPRRPIIFAGDIARAAICLWFIRGGGGVETYFIVAIAVSTLTQFAATAEGTLTPAIVDRADLARANAIGHAVGGAAQVLGLGVLTPLLLRVFDTPDVLFGLCAAMFTFAAFLALFIGRLRRSPRLEVGGEPSNTTGPWWKAGWRAMRRDPQVMHAAIELTLISAAIIVIAGLIPGYLTTVLELPVDVGAVVLMPAVAGIALGLRIAGFLSHRLPHTVLSSVGFAMFVPLLTLVTFVNPEAEFLAGYGAFAWLGSVSIGEFDGGGVLAMVITFPLGFAYAVVSVSAQTVINDRVPLHLQGRVNSTQAALSALVSALPVVIAGALSDVVGVTPVMALISAAVAVAAFLNFRPARRPAPGAAGALP